MNKAGRRDVLVVKPFTATDSRMVKREPDTFEKTTTSTRPDDVETLLPPFNPCSATGLTAEQWIGTIENIRRLYDWEDRLTLLYASNRLEADAKTWYRRQSCTWEGFKVLLVREFSKFWCRSEAFERLMHRRKDDRESFENYALDVERMAEECGFDLETTINYMISGLNDAEMRVHLVACSCATITEVLVRIRSFMAEQEELQKRLNLEENSPTRDPRKGFCNKFEDSGHFSRDNDRKRRVLNTTPEEPSTKVACLERHNDDYSDLLMTVRVRGENVTAFVNLASDCTTMKVSEFKRHEWKMQQTDVTLRGFGPGSARAFGKVSANVVAGEVAMVIDIQIVDDGVQEFPMVLGRDFLHNPKVCVVKKFGSLEIKVDRSEEKVESLDDTAADEDSNDEKQLLELLDLIERDCL